MKKIVIVAAVALAFGAASASAAPSSNMEEGVATIQDKADREIDTLNFGKGPSKPLGPRGGGSGGVITYSGSEEGSFWQQFLSMF